MGNIKAWFDTFHFIVHNNGFVHQAKRGKLLPPGLVALGLGNEGLILDTLDKRGEYTVAVSFVRGRRSSEIESPEVSPENLQNLHYASRDNGAELFLEDRIGEPQIAWDWIEQTAQVLEDLNVPMDNYARLASQLLRKEAYEWWKRTDESAGTPKPWTWAHFEWAFK
ncbi:unnamed protein product [Cuscuta campestris]|uniref:Retrotransposon gag domain-containing protein n=1 Tax=Cuscuta campestris TaxID=132261 RepID=A0A484KSI8_9ASTE|nr:unnamed protein product [Cuscuta campestris]